MVARVDCPALARCAAYWAAQWLRYRCGDGLTLLIGEGVATVLTAKQATGHPAIAALSSGNLAKVAMVMRESYPAARLVLLAELVKATGVADHHAVEAARAVGGLIAVPVFPDGRQDKDTDFNDMAQRHGLDAMSAAIASAREAAAGATPAGDSDCWPTPLPDGLPAVQAFDTDLLPEALRGWVADIAERMQCPPDFPAVGALVALSSLIGGRAVIAPKARDDWRVVPNLWGCIVGRPGVMKSPAL
jgi:putative DNA primase/helicase